ncbi:hypothetical protein BB559_003108 [Furculomyces boomerangus]|uniref:Phosphatidic acid phosphatase type 2/haloperoxidase domain-containing protein n=2 Tax=Harpellales TaxID=61421 RepID=A0A2T9YNU2_9FUNG|nr:hypothetical protein BB559_003108 [Furculomyces boomerangus]PWA02746.1 hypothetical protein BB558_001103 [Smittium angustum]
MDIFSFQLPFSYSNNGNFKKRAFDWIGIILALFILGAFEIYIPNNERLFSLNDPTIIYPHTPSSKQTITGPVLLILSFGVPTLVFVLFGIINTDLNEFYNSFTSFCLAHINTLLFTLLIKKVAGRPRPDFISRCKPDTNITPNSLKLYDKSICTQTNQEILAQGFKSFPSGHSSTTFVSVSRSTDYWHHWQDILAGMLIGIISGYVGFQKFFKSSDYNDKNDISISDHNYLLLNQGYREPQGSQV